MNYIPIKTVADHHCNPCSNVFLFLHSQLSLHMIKGHLSYKRPFCVELLWPVLVVLSSGGSGFCHGPVCSWQLFYPFLTYLCRSRHFPHLRRDNRHLRHPTFSPLCIITALFFVVLKSSLICVSSCPPAFRSNLKYSWKSFLLNYLAYRLVWSTVEAWLKLQRLKVSLHIIWIFMKIHV